jgi:hypothetical protein
MAAVRIGITRLSAASWSLCRAKGKLLQSNWVCGVSSKRELWHVDWIVCMCNGDGESKFFELVECSQVRMIIIGSYVKTLNILKRAEVCVQRNRQPSLRQPFWKGGLRSENVLAKLCLSLFLSLSCALSSLPSCEQNGKSQIRYIADCIKAICEASTEILLQ